MRASCRTPPASSASPRATRSACCRTRASTSLHLEAIDNALRDAGLGIGDVDGIFTASQHPPPRWWPRRWASSRATSTARQSAAARSSSWSSTRSPRCITACATSRSSRHGESGRSRVGMRPAARPERRRRSSRCPFGFGDATTDFALITARHMHEYGTTQEQLAEVAVSTRRGRSSTRAPCTAIR